VSNTYADLLSGERAARSVVETQNWIRTQQMKISESVQGDPPPDELGRRALRQLCEFLNAVAGSFFVAEPGGFRRLANFGLVAEANAWFADTEGLVGRAARGKTLLHVKDVPPNYTTVRSGTGEQVPNELVLLPSSVDGTVFAVLELAFFSPVDAPALELLGRVAETIAVALRSVQQKQRLADLLEEAQRQGEELQTQQEELRVANEELQQQGDVLRRAHAQLEEGKEELETSNSNLSLQRDALERAQSALTEKMGELERASRYKSEFLANMSHELRTPLNSSLILAKLLADNREGNLSEEQIKFATTIYSAGNDLLALINDILDLSKIEAGKVELRSESVTVTRLVEPVARTFEPVAKQKHVAFSVKLESEQALLETDMQRVQQILKNLLSNAFKFTERGSVSLSVQSTDTGYAFVVRDTGIGIAKAHHAAIFEAFQQADGTTNRAVHLSRLGAHAGRRADGGERARPRQQLHAAFAQGVRRGSGWPSASDDGQPAFGSAALRHSERSGRRDAGNPRLYGRPRSDRQPSPAAPDYRGRRCLCRDPGALGRRAFVSVLGRAQRRRRRASGHAISTGRDHSRYESAGSDRAHRSRPAEAK
jgi:signal transduction histidine kinase